MKIYINDFVIIKLIILFCKLQIKEKTDYKVHILVQKSNTSSSTENTTSNITPSPTKICEESENQNNDITNEVVGDKSEIEEKPNNIFSTPTTPSSGIYSCHACAFTTSRLNVLILHNKSHSVTFTAYTPSPVRKNFTSKLPSKSHNKSQKIRRPRKEKTEKTLKKTSQSKKRLAEEQIPDNEIKKVKTNEEIKSSLLADWDDGDEESIDDSTTMIMSGSPEVAVAAESPAIPTSAELPSTQDTIELKSPIENKIESSPSSEKPESSSDSKYEFCEDEDWHLETDAGRKIPRVKNPKRKEDTKSLSLDEDDVAKEVAELLNKTSVPVLPVVPEPLKVEENFPEPSVVKSPDKSQETVSENLIDKPMVELQPTKAIFKTKTFFRSRHSRSQDAIGKYVAEQLNAVERMDTSEIEINGSDVVSSLEARESPPIEHVKVARLAPKIQLKKMKAEAAQLRETEKCNNLLCNFQDQNKHENILSTGIIDSTTKEVENILKDDKQNDTLPASKPLQNVLYPTQEIKPIGIECSAITKTSVNQYTKQQSNLLKTPDDNVKRTNDSNLSEVKRVTLNESENKVPEVKFPDPAVQKPFEHSTDRYMNESTASAVDALLSVSRETDRVTRVISDDPPDELFEDDNKDTAVNNNINGDHKEESLENEFPKEINTESDKMFENTMIDRIVDKDTEIKKQVTDQDTSNDYKTIVPSLENTVTNTDVIIEQKISKEVIDNPSINIPSEADLQIAETLLNLPSTAVQTITTNEDTENLNSLCVSPKSEQIQDKTFEPTNAVYTENSTSEAKGEVTKDIINYPPESLLITNNTNRKYIYESEREKSENLNAAQSLVQMSESIDHKIGLIETKSVKTKDTPNKTALNTKQNNGIDKTVEQKVALLSSDNSSEINNCKNSSYETSSSKLLKILEEPCIPKSPSKTQTKQIILPRKEKILNFDVAKSSLKGKSPSPKQQIIIRRTAPPKNVINNINDVGPAQEKIILSRSNNPSQDGSAVQTYTIQTTPEVPSDANTIIIQQKIRKITKPPAKLQKIRPQNSLVAPLNEVKTTNDASSANDAMFDINSMPIVLSEDLLTPENIEKMPVVMSDGNIITHTPINPPKLIKAKQTAMECEKVAISATPNKTEIKTILVNPNNDGNKVTTPNILSKSSKLRGAKPMLVIDKATGKQKIIMTKAEPTVKEIRQTSAVVQPGPQSAKPEKFIILPSPSSPRTTNRGQKIMIDPQSGKAHVLVAKATETQVTASENKPVSAKLVPSSSDASVPGNTVMIITNAQGAQSRILLTPEHEKILFPNKQQPNFSQLKTIAHQISTNLPKTVVTTVASLKTHTTSTAKMNTRIVPKQKSAIITSKGQLIVGGRVTSTAQNIAPLPDIRPVPKRIMASEPMKLVQTIQKTTSEPLIFLQQKSGAMMQLTAAQFEHLQKTGQIVQKSPAPVQENKLLIQKPLSIPPSESVVTTVQKTRARKAIDSPAPLKKLKQDIAKAPAAISVPNIPVPGLTPISNSTMNNIQSPSTSNTVSVPSTTTYPDFDNFEDFLPSTAIVRQPEPVVTQSEQTLVPPSTSLSDGQLLAVPGEPFGGPQGSFYLCVEDNGTLTPIDNRPLILENNQLVPMTVEPLSVLTSQPERRDILEAALANSDVFHAETPRDEAPDFRDLNANVSVHCRVSETSTTLNQPIMTPVEVPTNVDSEPAVPSNLEDGLAVIGVTSHTVPTSLELPITVTDPRIAPKTTNPLSGTNYATTLLASPNTEMTFVTTEEPDISMVGPISMPLLTDEESIGKSMPILTDDVTDRTISSVDSTVGSPSSIDVRESETEDSVQWSRRLLTPGSDISETSAEIPLQPAIQLSINDLSHQS